MINLTLWRPPLSSIRAGSQTSFMDLEKCLEKSYRSEEPTAGVLESYGVPASFGIFTGCPFCLKVKKGGHPHASSASWKRCSKGKLFTFMIISMHAELKEVLAAGQSEKKLRAPNIHTWHGPRKDMKSSLHSTETGRHYPLVIPICRVPSVSTS